jgi:hypothetical protein
MKKPSVSRLSASDQQLGTFLLGNRHVIEILCELRLRRNRTDVDARLQRITNLECGDTCLHRVDELRINAFCHDQPARRGAALPGREERALHTQLDGLAQLGVVQHDLRILATHFELHLLQVDRTLLGNTSTDLLRAGEADRIDTRMVDQHVANHAAATHDQVEHARRDAAATDDVGNGPGTSRY